MYNRELEDEVYSPKPSLLTRNKKEFWYADKDTWIEIEVYTGKVDNQSHQPLMRSLFYSVRKKLGYWDEPPTGASTIIPKGADVTFFPASSRNKQKKSLSNKQHQLQQQRVLSSFIVAWRVEDSLPSLSPQQQKTLEI